MKWGDPQRLESVTPQPLAVFLLLRLAPEWLALTRRGLSMCVIDLNHVRNATLLSFHRCLRKLSEAILS